MKKLNITFLVNLLNIPPLQRALRFLIAFILSVSYVEPALAESFLEDPLNVTDKVGDVTDMSACSAYDPAHQLDLVSAIDIALCNNPQTQSSWAVAKTAAAIEGEARSNYLPAITLSANAGRVYSNRSSFGSTPASANSATQELDLSYLVYDFGGRRSLVESAKQQMYQASYNYNALIQSTVFQVIKAYLNVFTANENLDAARSAEVAGKEAFDAAQGRLKVGLVTRADTALAETAYSQFTLAVERAANELRLAKGAFAVLLHLPPNYDIDLAPVDPEKIGRPLSGDVENYIHEALEKRPDLAASLSREKQYEADLKTAKSAYYPKISVIGSATNLDYGSGTDRSQNDGAIALNLSVPLFTGFRNTYNKLAAKNALQSARYDRANVEDNVKLDVWNSYHNYQTSQQTYQTAQVLIKSAEASQAISLGRYKVGKGTLTDALTAQAQLADARRQVVQARYDTLITRFDLLRALGNVEWKDQLKPVIQPQTQNSQALGNVSENKGGNISSSSMPSSNNADPLAYQVYSPPLNNNTSRGLINIPSTGDIYNSMGSSEKR